MDDVLDLLYRGAIDPIAADGLAAKLAEAFGCHSCSIFVFDPTDGRTHGKLLTNQPEELILRYVDHYHALDPWRAPVLDVLGKAVIGEELFPERVLARTAFYNDFARQGDMFHLLAVTAPITWNRIAALTVHRAEKAESFDKADAGRLQDVLPHFRRAMQMRSVLEGRTQHLADRMATSMLDAMGCPAVICDGYGRPIVANEKAGSLRIEGCPFVQGRPGFLSVTLPTSSAHQSLLDRIADAARGGAGGHVRVSGGMVLVSPLPKSFLEFGIEKGSALVAVRIPDPAAMMDRAIQMFGFTPAEAAVSVSIALGATPDQVAAARSVKIGTVRTLLRRALDKAEASNLRNLSSLLVSTL